MESNPPQNSSSDINIVDRIAEIQLNIQNRNRSNEFSYGFTKKKRQPGSIKRQVLLSLVYRKSSNGPVKNHYFEKLFRTVKNFAK